MRLRHVHQRQFPSGSVHFNIVGDQGTYTDAIQVTELGAIENDLELAGGNAGVEGIPKRDVFRPHRKAADQSEYHDSFVLMLLDMKRHGVCLVFIDVIQHRALHSPRGVIVFLISSKPLF